MSADLIHTFPYLSIRFSGISIKDSLLHQHHHPFLNAENIFVRLRLMSIISGNPQVGKLIIENGTIFLYTDSTGYKNFERKNKGSTAKKEGKIPDLLFKKMRFVLQDDVKAKKHDLYAERLDCDISNEENQTVFNINIRSLVHQLTFNKEKGGYLKEKKLEGKFVAVLKDKILETKNTVLKIDGHPFAINASFNFNTDPKDFQLSISTKNIDYRKLSSLLTTVIQSKLKSFNINKPIDVTANLGGELAYKHIPKVKLTLKVAHAGMQTPVGDFNDCNFLAEFVNEIDPLKPRVDENSGFTIKKFSGNWQSIPIRSDLMEVTNLREPFLKCDIKSTFSLKSINDITESSTIQFTKGQGKIDIQYQGSIVPADTIPPVMNGIISMNDAVIKYLPRSLVLSNCDGKLLFKHHDLFIQKLNGNVGSTRLVMDGSVKNFLALLDTSPEKLALQWNIFSPKINMNDFMGFIGKSQSTAEVKKKSKGKPSIKADNIDRMLKNGSAYLTLKADNILYKRFNGTNLNASLGLVANKIILNNARLQHAGGLIAATGSLIESGKTSLMELKANLSDIIIPGIFYAFNNFGQDAITDKNMKGKLGATIQLNTAITENAEVAGNNLNGNISFSVTDGELINFEPIMKISETAFKKRDFSHIRFAELKNNLKIKGSAIYIDKMEIRSNVIKLFVEGVYDTRKGTDMSIQVPVTNLSKDNHEVLKLKGRAGLNLRLRAKTGDDGKLQVIWDPFNKAGKEREDSTEAGKGEKKEK